MGVISFPKFMNRNEPVKPTDWSDQEVADFFRAYHLLRQNGVDIGMDRGLTDIGEPWLVFYDSASQDVFLHIARINGRCILISEPLCLNIKAGTVTLLISELETAIDGFARERATHKDNVIAHPASRMILAISAVFLLFKIDAGSDVFAKGLTNGDTAYDPVLRKQELSALARAQAVLARLAETGDSPAAVAVVASAIIATEIARLNTADNQSERDGTVEIAQVATEILHAEANEKTAPEQNDDQAVEAVLADLENVPEVDLAALEVTPISFVDVGDEHNISTEAVVIAGVTPKSNKTKSSQKTEKDGTSAGDETSETSAGNIDQANIETETKVETTLRPLQATSDLMELDALDLANLKGVFEELGLVFDNTNFSLTPLEGTPDVVDVPVTEVSANDPVYTFRFETALESYALSNALFYMMGAIEDFDLRYGENSVTLNQVITDPANTDIGSWTNVMHDGGTITFVGQADIIDNIELFVQA